MIRFTFQSFLSLETPKSAQSTANPTFLFYHVPAAFTVITTNMLSTTKKGVDMSCVSVIFAVCILTI